MRGLEAEASHYMLHCLYYENERHIPLASIRDIESSIFDRNEWNIYGNDNCSKAHNTDIATGKVLLSSMRFEGNL